MQLFFPGIPSYQFYLFLLQNLQFLFGQHWRMRLSFLPFLLHSRLFKFEIRIPEHARERHADPGEGSHILRSSEEEEIGKKDDGRFAVTQNIV